MIDLISGELTPCIRYDLLLHLLDRPTDQGLHSLLPPLRLVRGLAELEEARRVHLQPHRQPLQSYSLLQVQRSGLTRPLTFLPT